MLLLMVMIPFHLSEMVLNTLFLKILKMVMVNISMLSHYLQQRDVRRQCQNHDIYLRCHFLLSLPAIQAFHRAANFCFCIHAAGGLFAINRSKLTQDYQRSELGPLFWGQQVKCSFYRSVTIWLVKKLLSYSVVIFSMCIAKYLEVNIWFVSSCILTSDQNTTNNNSFPDNNPSTAPSTYNLAVQHIRASFRSPS